MADVALLVATLVVAAIGACISAVYLWLSLRWRRTSVRPWPYIAKFDLTSTVWPQTADEPVKLGSLRVTFGNRGEPGHSVLLVAQADSLLWFGAWIPATRLQTGTCQMAMIACSTKVRGVPPTTVALIWRDLDGAWWLGTHDEPKRLRNLNAALDLLADRVTEVAIQPLRFKFDGEKWSYEVDMAKMRRTAKLENPAQ